MACFCGSGGPPQGRPSVEAGGRDRLPSVAGRRARGRPTEQRRVAGSERSERAAGTAGTRRTREAVRCGVVDVSQSHLADDHEARNERVSRLRLFAVEHWGEVWAEASPEAIERRLEDVLTGEVDRSQPGNPTVSLATCEKVPTSAEEAASSRDYPETFSDLEHVTDAAEAIQVSTSRSRERQAKVLGLIEAGEVAHAKRLAMCNRQSVQLECGDCGSDENYVPVSCNSKLCPDCMNDKMGRVAGQYLQVVEGWDHATMMRLSLPDRVEPDRVETAVDAIRGAFGRLRRRKMNVDEDTFKKWMRALRALDERGLAKRCEIERRNGRGIPVDWILRSGFYGIDIKQGEDGTLNVHLHILADVPYLPQSVLSDLWDDVIGAPVVDIRRVEQRGQSDEETALMEVIGYAAKAPEWESVDDQIAYFEALKGSKLIQPFGDLHGNTPTGGEPLFCYTCERTPEEWRYLGTVDGCYETVGVGSAPDGDRPPPGAE